MRSLLILLMLVPALALAEAETSAGDTEPSAAEMLYKGRCVDLCHQTPSAIRLKPKQWRVVLNTMQKRMQSAGMPPLNDEEFEMIYNYLTENRGR